MKKRHGYFNGIYKTADKQYDVRGTYTTIPGGYVGDASGIELVACHYWATEIVDGFSNGPRESGAYLREVHGLWQIGALLNQQFKPYKSHFLEWLKETIVAKDDQDFPDFIEQL